MSNGSRVVILGGGFGGLETAFNLRLLAGDTAQLTLISDQNHFLFKPNSIYVPFGLDPEKLKVSLDKPTKRRGIDFIRAKATAVDIDAGRVETEAGSVPYDQLVIATGADMRASEVPGLAEHAISTWTPADMLSLRSAFERLVERQDAIRQRVLFLVPPNNKCAGPLYEIVLMLETWLRGRGARENTEITWSTYEETYIQAFGPRLHEVVEKEFARRDISGHHNWVVERVEADAVHYENGEQLPYDLLVSFPPYIASTPFEGLPADDRGFLETDLATRKVVGHPEMYAVGDAGDFPVKQAFLAFLQADAAASQLAGREPKLDFDPVSMCVMEQFDKATFAQVPLRLTGDPSRPIEVRPDADGAYRVGSYRAWRAGKKMLGYSVPWRFRNGLPFHGGNFWRAMDAGLKAMSKVLAD
ncbi:MAG TPA: FAD-dependent oxidoreductase [Solirubrobacterales bacterium]|nr:FAD-dependent oxidoreductase [Solirubrobacterales bacterium]